mmetsp:Transcript_59720/g.106516  ORF Transcript_59720/g.106516 Transcript_59720/m.106516 type:complete len:207 (+) Transcript_59720:113-733(+)
MSIIACTCAAYSGSFPQIWPMIRTKTSFSSKPAVSIPLCANAALAASRIFEGTLTSTSRGKASTAEPCLKAWRWRPSSSFNSSVFSNDFCSDDKSLSSTMESRRDSIGDGRYSSSPSNSGTGKDKDLTNPASTGASSSGFSDACVTSGSEPTDDLLPVEFLFSPDKRLFSSWGEDGEEMLRLIAEELEPLRFTTAPTTGNTPEPLL